MSESPEMAVEAINVFFSLHDVPLIAVVSLLRYTPKYFDASQYFQVIKPERLIDFDFRSLK
jgi:hypothetical protein